MDVVGVDPRDQRWEVDEPRYRVHFHEASGASDEYEITGADVDEVIAFAERRREGRMFVLYVWVDGVDGPGLVRLLGTDPNAALQD